ncbi:DEAD/DEAH box helicase [Kangiella sp. TOML190]|uniref:DEAD/DEAH box helicase n=1 Tax=Kangiella sp. TOML190 TaxID=2931351 RepID=UPI0020420735|nr:DEAD/DEAH box helicase [Kangiella sp. TOML190]
MSFKATGLIPELLQTVMQQGYDKPSPIQLKAIPEVLNGRDLLAAAQTGTGKTAGFTLPILQLLSKGKKAKSNCARALILAPTRELAAQVGKSVETYGKSLSLSSLVVFGGVKINPQMMRLRKGVDILVATPGRLLDLHQQNTVKFDQLEILVLDEADRMLDMGFIHDIKRILKVLPATRQNLMFSATFSDEIRALAKTIVNNPVEVSVSPPNAAAKSVKQWFHPVDKKQKSGLLIELITEHRWHQVLVFVRTKHGANKLVKQLNAAKIKALAIHGNKSQGARTKALADFKSNKIQVLVATDIAARGIDINQLPQVVNFDLPNVAEDYVHRIGRTGRAGAQGQAVSLVAADEIKQLEAIEQLIQKHIEREYVGGFEPSHEVPASKPIRPKKVKKPKKPKNTKAQQNNQTQPAAKSHQAKGKTNLKAKAKSKGKLVKNKSKVIGRNAKADSVWAKSNKASKKSK